MVKSLEYLKMFLSMIFIDLFITETSIAKMSHSARLLDRGYCIFKKFAVVFPPTIQK